MITALIVAGFALAAFFLLASLIFEADRDHWRNVADMRAAEIAHLRAGCAADGVA